MKLILFRMLPNTALDAKINPIAATVLVANLLEVRLSKKPFKNSSSCSSNIGIRFLGESKMVFSKSGKPKNIENTIIIANNKGKIEKNA